jgi:hypothetical protein
MKHLRALYHIVIASNRLYADLRLSLEAEPLMHMSLCPEKPILAGFLGSFALYQ